MNRKCCNTTASARLKRRQVACAFLFSSRLFFFVVFFFFSSLQFGGFSVFNTLHVQEQHSWIFHHRLDLPQESHGFPAVDEPVVVRQSHVHHGPDLHLRAAPGVIVIMIKTLSVATLLVIHIRISFK